MECFIVTRPTFQVGHTGMGSRRHALWYCATLQAGDVIHVTKQNDNGLWEGELSGRTGHFPFTHVEVLPS